MVPAVLSAIAKDYWKSQIFSEGQLQPNKKVEEMWVEKLQWGSARSCHCVSLKYDLKVSLEGAQHWFNKLFSLLHWLTLSRLCAAMCLRIERIQSKWNQEGLSWWKEGVTAHLWLPCLYKWIIIVLKICILNFLFVIFCYIKNMVQVTQAFGLRRGDVWVKNVIWNRWTVFCVAYSNWVETPGIRLF